jgi:hypothetical protein
MSTNGVTFQDKPLRNLREWGIVMGDVSARSFLVNLHGDAVHTELPGVFDGRARKQWSLYLLGRPCFFRDAYLYQETTVLGPGSDLARGIITGVGVSRVVLPLGLYGKSVGVSLLPSEISLLECLPEDVIEALSSQVERADELNASVQRGAPRIQLAHGNVPRA